MATIQQVVATSTSPDLFLIPSNSLELTSHQNNISHLLQIGNAQTITIIVAHSIGNLSTLKSIIFPFGNKITYMPPIPQNTPVRE